MTIFNRLLPQRFRRDETVIPVVRLSGAIMAGGSPLRQNLSLASVAGVLERAFADKRAPAVAIAINSPGGSPVQSRLIFKRIRDLADEKDKQVFVFVEDVAASGGYMIACAGDEIIADPSSIVGSIGVVAATFGLTGLIEKLGVQRRVYTAGENKVMLDPFQPENPKDVDHLLDLQREIHRLFIDLVKSRRGARLADDPQIFTGSFWTGERAKALGLVDGVDDMRSFLKKRFGEKTKLRLVAPPRGLFSRRPLGVMSLEGGEDIASGFAKGLMTAAEERGLWSRYGL
jgi:signal peptide peptidase SppA